MAQTLKGKFPWRIGATSYVVPADLMTNVRLLADTVDDVQLLFFESFAGTGMEHRVDVAGLRQVAHDHDLTYTVHLPTDIRLGSADPHRREQGIAEIVRLINELEVLSPLSFDLHLLPEPDLPDSEWQDCLDQSLGVLSKRLGNAVKLLAIENIDYPLSLVLPLVRSHGFSLCLDAGHIQRYGHDFEEAVQSFLPLAGHVHLHGVADGRDHRALGTKEVPLVAEFGEKLAAIEYTGVVTLEVYRKDWLEVSLKILQETWGRYGVAAMKEASIAATGDERRTA